MKPDQVDVLTPAVFGNLHQRVHALETRFAGEVMGDVTFGDLLDRIDDDRPIVHDIAAADLDARTHPDTDGTPDSATPDAVTQLLSE